MKTSIQDHLYSQDESRRKFAAYILSRSASAAVVEELFAAMKHSNRYVATRAAWGLTLMAPSLVVPGLSIALLDLDPAYVSQAAWALGRIRNPRARRVLVDALSARRKHVRYQAANGLWRHAALGYKNRKAARLLTGMLKGDTGSAAATLRRMRDSRIDPKARKERGGSVFKRMGGEFIR